MASIKKIKTTYHKELLDAKTAESAYIYLKNNIQWEDGIYSKRQGKISRKGYSIGGSEDVDEFILQLILGTKIIEKAEILGIYLNYYIDGQHFCPAHSHQGMMQFVISLGATRKFTVGKKEYAMHNGDAIIFGSSTHSIPIEPEVKDGRISIAIFLKKD